MNIQRSSSGPLETIYGLFTIHAFKELKTQRDHIALTMGNLSFAREVLVRVHSSCITSESFLATNCECREQLNEATRLISDYGNGVIVYLDQEGRGNGLKAKIEALNEVIKGKSPVEVFNQLGYPADQRDYSVVADIFKYLNIYEKNICLLTNNPLKSEGLIRCGIKIRKTKQLYIKTNKPLAMIDLYSKRKDLGHNLPVSEESTPIQYIKDNYSAVRGGYSRLLLVSCGKCDFPILIYQKDGSGPLKRCFVDRIVKPFLFPDHNLVCSNCRRILAVPQLYKKENRIALRTFQNSLTKRVISKEQARSYKII